VELSGKRSSLFEITITEKVKDQLSDQRGGGSEWEPIKIFLEGD
jgi:hypothetical protein